MRLGFAVKVLGAGGLPTQDTRRWQSGPHLKVSIEYLHAVFAYCDDAGIRMYRMTASLAPYATHTASLAPYATHPDCAWASSSPPAACTRRSSTPGRSTPRPPPNDPAAPASPSDVTAL